jgi:hypothetical protein
MFKVDKCEWPPSYCAVTGRSDAEWYIDTMNNIPIIQPHIYVSNIGLRELVRTAGGYVPQSDFDSLRADLEAAEQRIEDLEAENNDLARFQDAIDTIESRDFRARKKVGRPKTKVEA